MEENKNLQELDAFAKKYVKEIHIESPSIDFTASIMNKIIVAEKQKSLKTTESLISTKMWFFILTLVLAAIFIPFKSSEKSFIQFPKLDFSFLNSIQIPTIFDANAISNTVLYAILCFGFMILIQVFYLKNYFNKRLH